MMNLQNKLKLLLMRLLENEIEEEVEKRLRPSIDELDKKATEMRGVIDEAQKIAEQENAIMEKLARVEAEKADNDMVHVHVVFAIPLIENEETGRRAAAAVMQALAERIKAAVSQGKGDNRGQIRGNLD